MFTVDIYSNVDYAKMQFNISLCCCFRDRIVQLDRCIEHPTQAPTERILKKELTFETRIGNRFHFGFKHGLVQASSPFYLQKNGTITYDILRMVALCTILAKKKATPWPFFSLAALPN